MECSFSLCMMHDTSQSGFPYSFVLQVEQVASLTSGFKIQ